MRYAVLSDIHGNLDAFEEVLKDIRTVGVDQIICLGDMIGYGPQPEEVIAEIRRSSIRALMGNHELAVVDRGYLDWFNKQARHSLVQTVTLLSPDSMAFIRQLKRFLRIGECHFVHGYPPDSPLTYLFQVSEEALIKTFMEMDFRIGFLGHTHNLEIISYSRNGLTRSPLCAGKTSLGETEKHILNIGSVGQPRDGNADAKYVVLDSDENIVELRYVSYDFRTVAEKIIAAGLPEVHARRLFPK